MYCPTRSTAGLYGLNLQTTGKTLRVSVVEEARVDKRLGRAAILSTYMTSKEYAEIEALTARGLTDIEIAAALELDALEVADLISGSRRGEIISHYRQRCIRRAVADPYPDEAAEYLYVRSVPARMIAKTGIVRHRHVYSEVAKDKKARYQARQLKLARERLQTGRLG